MENINFDHQNEMDKTGPFPISPQLPDTTAIPVDLQTSPNITGLYSESIHFLPAHCSQLQTILGATVEDIRKFCHADTVSIMLLDAGTEELTIAYAPKLDHHIAKSVRTKMGVGIAGYVVQSGIPILIENIWEDHRFEQSNRPDSYRSSTILSVPLRIQGRVLGVINVTDPHDKSSFSQSDLDLLVTLTNRTGMMIDQAWTVSNLSRDLDRLSALYQISIASSCSHSSEELFHHFLKTMRAAVKCDYAIGFSWDGFENIARLKGTDGIQFQKNFNTLEFTPELEKAFMDSNVKESIKESVITQLIANTHSLSMPDDESPKPAMGLNHHVIVPLHIHDEFLGFFVFGRRQGDCFDSHEKEILSVLCHDAAQSYRQYIQMFHHSQLASMGEWVATVAHDLKHPLASISDQLSQIRDRWNLENNMNSACSLDSVLKETEWMNELVQELLHFANPNNREEQSCQIGEILNEIVVLVSTHAKKRNINIRQEFDFNLPEIILDIRKFKEAALNIIGNAFDAMPGGGELCISAKVVHKFPLIKSRDSNPKSMIQVIFKDNGVGIPIECLNKIFTRFYTTKEQGTGLGLVITKRLIESMGGSIEVESEPRKGTSFIFNFPLKPNLRD